VPAGARVTYDSNEPDSRVPARERGKVPERTKRRVLDDVVGIIVISDEPFRQATPGFQVRQDEVIEFLTRSTRAGRSAHVL